MQVDENASRPGGSVSPEPSTDASVAARRQRPAVCIDSGDPAGCTTFAAGAPG